MTKFMCKEFLLTLVSLMFGIAGLNAQVTIGADEAPHSGAILDLRSDTTTGKGKGLKLPVVKITDASKFQLSADASTAEGMLVFNINPSIIGGHGKGLYVWSNSTWNLVSPTVSAAGIKLNKTELTFTSKTVVDTLVAEVFPTYSVSGNVIWTSSVPTVASITVIADSAIITPLASGTTTITVQTADGSQSAVCEVAVALPGDFGDPDATYKPSMSGKTCIDVRTGQPDPGTQKYIITETGTKTIKNVIWVITKSTDGLLVKDSVSGTGNTTQNLVFKSQAELLALAASQEQTITLNAYIEYSDSKKIKLSRLVQIRNRECCQGVEIPGGVHTGGTYSYTGGKASYDNQMSSYKVTRDISKNLCVYYKNGSGNEYDRISNKCANGEDIDAADRGVSWRLPHPAELAQMSTANANAPWAPRYNALSSAAGADPRTQDLASGKYASYYSGIGLFYWHDFSDSQTNYASTQYWSIVRCVRTMN
jgi:hypothetical protein